MRYSSTYIATVGVKELKPFPLCMAGLNNEFQVNLGRIPELADRHAAVRLPQPLSRPSR